MGPLLQLDVSLFCAEKITHTHTHTHALFHDHTYTIEKKCGSHTKGERYSAGCRHLLMGFVDLLKLNHRNITPTFSFVPQEQHLKAFVDADVSNVYKVVCPWHRNMSVSLFCELAEWVNGANRDLLEQETNGAVQAVRKQCGTWEFLNVLDKDKKTKSLFNWFSHSTVRPKGSQVLCNSYKDLDKRIILRNKIPENTVFCLKKTIFWKVNMMTAAVEDFTIPDQGSSLSWTSFIQSITLHGVKYISGWVKLRWWIQTLPETKQLCVNIKLVQHSLCCQKHLWLCQTNVTPEYVLLKFRFLWCVAVLLCLSQFSLDKLETELQHKTSVNVEVIYPPELDLL